jgi:hypothetical protein
MNKDYVYDIEFYQNFFCVNFRSFPEGGERITFEISSRKNQRKELLEFLEQEGLRLIGYNNVGYDYPVLHYLIESPEISLMIWWKKVQRDIFQERKGIIWESQRKVFQIDLFKINHYDNLARSSSLKWLEFTKRWHKVQDLPIPPDQVIVDSQMDEMISYCWNDVDFTWELAHDCWNAVTFRENMTEVLGRNVMDYSDVKLGEYLNQKKYEELSGSKYKEFRDLKTYRKSYNMTDIIPDVVEFHTPVMKKFLEELRGRTFIDSKHDVFRYDIVINDGGEVIDCRRREKKDTPAILQKEFEAEWGQHNIMVTFAKGGLHSIDMPKIVDRKEGWVLAEKDVASMYPRGIVVDKIYPKHLGESWNEGISNAYDYRNDVLKPKMKKLEYGSLDYQKVDGEQAVYKLAMNGGGFGKLGSEYSWQYDPLAKYRVTMGCELKLLMLIEAFCMRGIQVISVNTDGVVIHYPKEKQQQVDLIHDWWEKKTQFVLEDTFYKKMVFSSVNDYIAVIVDPITDEVKKVKYKGDYEINKEAHKNNSQRIVPIILSEYFVNGVDPEQIIGHLGYKFKSDGKEEQVTIYDYCIGVKKTRNCEYYLVTRGKAHMLKDKVIRYYVSKEPNQLLKKYTNGKSEGKFEKVSAGFDITLFMDFFGADRIGGDYKIDKRYYKNEVRKIIDSIEKGNRIMQTKTAQQSSLF